MDEMKKDTSPTEEEAVQAEPTIEQPAPETVFTSAEPPQETPAAEPMPESLIPERETAQSNFSEMPGGNWSRPVEPTPAPYTIPPTPTFTHPPRKPFFADFTNSKLVALMLCLCILVSGISGFAGVLIGRSVGAANSAPPSTTVLWETAPATALPSGNSNTDALTAAVEGVFDTVVEISTETVVSGMYFGQSVQSGAGSGVVISNDGYIVTNNHVIDGADTITVRLSNGATYTATLRGTDSWTDLAVLKIDVTEPLDFAAFGNSGELNVGQKVFAIGNPLGTLGGSVSDGIISACDREITVDGMPMTLLQTNAAVNPGNSGGGLFNLAGQLVGIVNAKYTDESVEGLGFAIPANITKDIVEDLIAQGYVTGRPQIGVELISITSSNVNSFYSSNTHKDLFPYVNAYGIYVWNAKNATIVSGSLQLGDMLVSVDGKTVSSFSDIQNILREHQVGDELVLKIKRQNVEGEQEVTIRLTQKTITVPQS